MKIEPYFLAFTLLACAGDGDEPSDEPDPPSGNGDITWCQALGVLESSCQRCHADPPVNGAPVPLVSYADTQARWGTSDFETWEKMRNAVDVDFMPATFIDLEPPVQPLSCEEKTTLLGWLEQGAKLVGPESCSEADKTLLDCAAVGAGGAGP